MSIDEQKARAHKLGQQMRVADFEQDDNPYAEISQTLSASWASGYGTVAGLIQAVNGWSKQQEEK